LKICFVCKESFLPEGDELCCDELCEEVENEVMCFSCGGGVSVDPEDLGDHASTS